jgi:hypothetical protein
MKKGQKPRAAALADAEVGGLSVFREDIATDNELRRVATGLVNRARQSHNTKAGVFGVLRITCESVRKFADSASGVPSYCVYDTALHDLKSHSEIFQQVYKVDGPVRDQRRTEFFRLLEPGFVPVQDFRNGLLADLAPQEP